MADLEEFVFVQEPSLGGETFILRRDRVVVRDRMTGERHVPLAEIADVEMTKRRFTRFAIPLFVFAAVFGAAAWRISGPTYWSAQILSLVFFGLAVGSVGALYIAIQPISVARIRNKQGNVLFELYRERSVAVSFEEFLLHLRRRIPTWRSD